MEHVLDLLERLGADGQARRAFAVGDLAVPGIDADVRAALVAGDESRLRSLLGATNVCCALMPPKKPFEEEPSREDDQELPLPDDQTSLHGTLRLVG